MKEELKACKIELDKLLSSNDRADELEKLDREEFVIDLAGQTRLIAEGDKKAEDVRRRIETEDLTRDLIASRLRSEVWDSMEIKGKVIKALKDPGLEVFNFPTAASQTMSGCSLIRSATCAGWS